MRLPRVLGCSGVAIVLVLVAASPAGAATFTTNPFNVGFYTASTGETNDLVVSASATTVTIQDLTEPLSLSPQSSACTQADANTVTCPSAAVSGGFEARLGDGDDDASLSNLPSVLSLVVGGDGDDAITGGAQSAESFGDGPNTGNPYNYDPAGDGDDTISGGAGVDFIDGGAGSDDVSGGAGSGDTATYQHRTGPGTKPVIVDAGGQSDGDDSNGDGQADEGDTVASDVEVLSGGDGDDRLIGGRIIGNGGDDLLDISAAGTGSLAVGNAGTDTASYAGRATPLVVDLESDPQDNALTPNDGEDTNADGQADEGDMIDEDVENVIAGAGNDKLLGSEHANAFRAGDGDDTMSGGDGGDTFDGGSGADRMTGGAADDTFDGGSDADTMSGEGGSGDRASYASRSAASPVAVDLDDVADDGGTDDGPAAGARDNVKPDVEHVEGGAGGDSLTGSAAANHVSGGAGNDVLAGQGGADLAEGGNGNDVIDEGSVASVGDTLDGGLGADTLSYAQRAQRVAVVLDSQANDGADPTGNGSSSAAEEGDRDVGIESATTGPASDRLTGSAAPNQLHAGGGDDRLSGLNGPDLLDGGAGQDFFDEGARRSGADTVLGGAGADTLSYAQRGGSVAVRLDGRRNDGADLDRNGVSRTTEEGDRESGVEDATGGAGRDFLAGSATFNLLTGHAGNDRLMGRDGRRDTLACGPGAADATRNDPVDRRSGCERTF